MKNSTPENNNATASRTDKAVVCDALVRDGTDRLCMALYGRKAEVCDWIGGSEARMIHDAARVIEAARCIRHWHDTHNGGMIVSGDHVRALWESFPNVRG